MMNSSCSLAQVNFTMRAPLSTSHFPYEYASTTSLRIHAVPPPLAANIHTAIQKKIGCSTATCGADFLLEASPGPITGHA
jgi:hypothetical protein